MQDRLKRVIPIFLISALPWLVVWIVINQSEVQEFSYTNKVVLSCKNAPSVYHNKFEELHKEFDTPQEVTAACLGCHTERHREILKTAHWNWERETYIEGRGVTYLGKKNILNNFCVGIAGSEGTCTRCHIGYGWKDKTFDFNEKNNIDCLVCHDNTGDYKKKKGSAGYPVDDIDLAKIAQNVCTPKRENCGVCHFNGGGGNCVKHGDLENAMSNWENDSVILDVHMDVNQQNMTCTECHVTEKHNITGRLYAVSSSNDNRVSCEQCHGGEVHADESLNTHSRKIACQTCHIPVYAKNEATKVWWDWSKAGQLNADSSKIFHKDSHGHYDYLSIKGFFINEHEIEPEYAWFNGTADHHILGDKIEEIPLQMNVLHGEYSDKDSKIWPMKVMRGKQIYDSEYNTLIQPKLWDKEKGKGAYWVDFDWDASARAGMEYVGQPYSGNYDFVETEMFWPLNHQVSPAEEALSCTECHSRDGRLEKLTDFYLPGRDYNAGIDLSGVLIIILTIGGVLIHAIIRMVSSKNN